MTESEQGIYLSNPAASKISEAVCVDFMELANHRPVSLDCPPNALPILQVFNRVRQRRQERGDHWFDGLTFQIDPFWLGMVMILVFAVGLNWLPAAARDGPRTLIMPALTLALINASSNLRITRSSMLEVLDSEYIKLARAKGVSELTVVWKHAFRNAVIAPLTNAGLLLAGFMAGTVVTETVFAWPGMGRLAIDAVRTNDFPVVSALTLIFTVIYVGANFLIDLTYGLVDPRIRLS